MCSMFPYCYHFVTNCYPFAIILPLFLFPEIWNESAHTKLASKMTFLGDWGCASNEQRRPV